MHVFVFRAPVTTGVQHLQSVCNLKSICDLKPDLWFKNLRVIAVVICEVITGF